VLVDMLGSSIERKKALYKKSSDETSVVRSIRESVLRYQLLSSEISVTKRKIEIETSFAVADVT
jgi:hypothetical protein